MKQLTEKQRTHLHTIRNILETGHLTERESRGFTEKYLELSKLSGEDKVAIRMAIVAWEAEQFKIRKEKRVELERQRMLAELEAESKPIRREARTLREKMKAKGWTVS